MNRKISNLVLGLVGLLVTLTPVAAGNVGPELAARDGTIKSRAAGSTSKVSRSLFGNVPYGQIVTQCTRSRTVALTFDDGPSVYTETVLGLLKQYNAKATFFITANNGMGPIETEPWGSLARRILAEGHQIAHHSWTHLDMSTLDSNSRQDEIVRAEEAFVEALGQFPTYLRPPYGSCNADCLAQTRRLGYHVVNWDVDTDDWRYQDEIERSESQFKSLMAASGSHIVLAHDIHYNTSARLTRFMLELVKKKGLRPVTVGDCLGDPAEFWYRKVSRSSGGVLSLSNPTPTPGSNSIGTPSGSGSVPTQRASVDGRCGGDVTCAGTTWGSCCSMYNWCGSTADHCKTGCQPQFGRCK